MKKMRTKLTKQTMSEQTEAPWWAELALEVVEVGFTFTVSKGTPRAYAAIWLTY